jgi:hypothetical protein
MGPMPNTLPTAGDIFGQTQQRAQSAIPNLLDDELSSILGTDSNIGGFQTPSINTNTSVPVNNRPTTSGGNLLDDLFGDLNLSAGAPGLSFSSSNTFALPKEVRYNYVGTYFLRGNYPKWRSLLRLILGL